MDAIRQALVSAIVPALQLLPARMDCAEARVLMVAIGLQESGLTARAQLLAGGRRGAARGLWQFEVGGGVHGVLTHSATRALALQLCQARGVNPVEAVVWSALETDDVLAAGLARLLLVSDPAPLPPIGAQERAWDYYLRNWRPGKPHVLRWAMNYQAALAACV